MNKSYEPSPRVRKAQELHARGETIMANARATLNGFFENLTKAQVLALIQQLQKIADEKPD